MAGVSTRSEGAPPSVILGIHDGHGATACLLKDGRVVAAVGEERLSRSKNDPGYPRRAINEVLRIGNCSPSDVDAVALGTNFMHNREFFFNWDWYRKGYSDQLSESEREPNRREYFLRGRLEERRRTIVDHLGIASEDIDIVEHHEGHAAAAYFESPWAYDEEPTLVLTLDGSGDGVCSTVNIARGSNIERIASTGSDASIGKVYSRLTFLLGMRPWDHEYKLMGLAPYADEAGLAKSYGVIRPLVELDGLTFRKGTELSTNYCYPHLRTHLENHRFDWIAGAAQRVVEELMVAWTANAIRETGVRRVACGGGVFMNVKANMLLAELPELDELFVFPSCGDESICFGAAHSVSAALGLSSQATISGSSAEIYLGPEYSPKDIEECLERLTVGERYEVRRSDNVNEDVARLLAAGEIVARFAGRMEWGSRALGNRSILMDARHGENVKVLNAAIKHRDFWMPFAPTILADRQSDYVALSDGARGEHMMVGSRATPRAQVDLAAAVHPYDGTVRPQLLSRDANAGYYDVLRYFEKITGVGGVLNTSFNLHGEPIVCSPDDAVSTFERSGLQVLALGDYLISKHPLLLS